MAIDSAPCSALIFFILSAMKVNASSHETVAHSSLPRSPLRSSGWRRRSGSLTAPTAPVPRGHSRPRLCGSIGLPSNFHSLPSRTWAMPPQRQKHISHIVGIVLTLPPPTASAACDASGDSCPATAPAPNVAPVICRKRRRVNACVILNHSWVCRADRRRCVHLAPLATGWPGVAPIGAPSRVCELDGRQRRGRPAGRALVSINQPSAPSLVCARSHASRAI